MKEKLGLAIVPGFGDKGIAILKKAIEDDLQPHVSIVIPSILSTSPDAELEDTDEITKRVGTIIDEISAGVDILLELGHSFGGHVAAGADSRRTLRSQGRKRVVLIDAPLNSRVKVEPVKFDHNRFARYYRQRPAISREYEETFARNGTAPLVTICTQNDRIVPFEAKKLDGLTTVVLENAGDVDGIAFDSHCGINIVLPQEFEGHSLEAKIPIITTIVRKSLRDIGHVR